MNNDFYKTAYETLYKHVKALLSNCHANEYLSVWILENGKHTSIQNISYIGYGLVSLTINRDEEIIVSLQSLQVHFEFVNISRRTPGYSFGMQELDQRLQA